jgi:hypothetical protein
MTRLIRTWSAVVAASAAVVVIVGSGGCSSSGVGDPCTPEQEYLTSFTGFSVQEVNVESKSFQCLTRLCLVNHFQGRVSCPYGQNADGSNIAGSQSCTGGASGPGCCTPGVETPVDGKDPDCVKAKGPNDPSCFLDSKNQAKVPGQCVDRTADKAVYCSCRCANVNGRTDDGANYCSCPDGFSCTQLVSSVSDTLDQGLTGGYCVKNGTQFDPATVPQGGTCVACDPTAGNCGKAQGVAAR